jgi:GNAT superfamily N-acetyltransferase
MNIYINSQVFEIAQIQNSEVNEVAGILTDAFKTNSAYSLIFKTKQEKGLFWLFKTALFLNNHKHKLTSVVKEKNTGKIIGTFTFIPPGGVQTGLSIYFKIGIIKFISKFGINSLLRMLQLDSLNKNRLTKSIKSSEYYYLSMVVIRKEYRGAGIGTAALKFAIEEFIASNPACKLIGLTTQLPENVTFYSRLGFDKIDEGYVDFKKDRYYNYNMQKLN